MDDYKNDNAREISGEGADVSNDDGGEASHILTLCEGPLDGVL